jgi:hypothetical protein
MEKVSLFKCIDANAIIIEESMPPESRIPEGTSAIKFIRTEFAKSRSILSTASFDALLSLKVSFQY